MASTHMKMCSESLAFREKQMKTTVSNYLPHIHYQDYCGHITTINPLTSAGGQWRNWKLPTLQVGPLNEMSNCLENSYLSDEIQCLLMKHQFLFEVHSEESHTSQSGLEVTMADIMKTCR